jgi:hypothetical protein
MTQFTVFGKNIKKSLVDIGQTQNWLIDKVRDETGLYFDSSYLYKVMTGRVSTPSVVNAICKTLSIEYEQERERKETA